jgi:hypothetical protein
MALLDLQTKDTGAESRVSNGCVWHLEFVNNMFVVVKNLHLPISLFTEFSKRYMLNATMAYTGIGPRFSRL